MPPANESNRARYKGIEGLGKFGRPFSNGKGAPTRSSKGRADVKGRERTLRSREARRGNAREGVGNRRYGGWVIVRVGGRDGVGAVYVYRGPSITHDVTQILNMARGRRKCLDKGKCTIA